MQLEVGENGACLIKIRVDGEDSFESVGATPFPVKAGEGVSRGDIALLGQGPYALKAGRQAEFLLRCLIPDHIAGDQSQDRAGDHGKAERPCEQTSHGPDCSRRRPGRGTCYSAGGD